MSEINREEIIEEIDTKIKYAKFVNTDAVILSRKAAQFCLEHAQYYEQRIGELTEEKKKLGKAFDDLLKEAETYLKQRDALQNRVKYLEKNNNERQTND